ncbi:MAG: ArsR family transcriptional regulator [Lentisphaerae bacterium]|nr:ArsR family transcriptional regulator [Lentisphaerota bacterium]
MANRLRLRLLQGLLRDPGQTVSEMARRIGVSRPVASMYLRALNARGFLKAQRSGTWVSYRPAADRSNPNAAELLSALEDAFAARKDSMGGIYRLITAFTHPRRLDIVRALQAGELTAREIRMRIDISRDALRRHLRKLQARGFLIQNDGRWRCACPRAPLAATLLRLACGR